MTHVLVEALIDHFRNVPRERMARGDFYRINHEFIQVAREQGLHATVEDAARLLESAVPPSFWNDIARARDVTYSVLDRIAEMEPRTILDQPILDLLDGRPGDAVRGMGEVQRGGIENFAKYRSILNRGEDRGLAIWQVMNPFYFLWATLPVARTTPSDRWREDQFNNAPESESDSSRSANERTLVEFLRGELGSAFWSTASVMECGCGHGHTAGLLIEELGVDPSRYRAFDLHDKRVERTRAVVSSHERDVSTPSPAAAGGTRFISLDILADDAAERIRGLGEADVVFSTSFTNVFDDAQLPLVLRRMTLPKPKVIVDISVTTSWAFCIGRFDPSDAYRAAGYQARASRLETPALAANETHRLWMPQRYWSNRNILIYERIPDHDDGEV